MDLRPGQVPPDGRLLPGETFAEEFPHLVTAGATREREPSPVAWPGDSLPLRDPAVTES